MARLSYKKARLALILSPRYRLCWCSAVALVLLRVGIGWHFLYEGLSKIESHREGSKPFSAEGYLANSTGPLRPWFRSHLDDPDGIERLEPASIAARWERIVEEMTVQHRLSESQQASARAKIRELEIAKEAYFRNAENRQKVQQYRDDITAALEAERSELAYERERAREKQRELAATRKELLAPIDAWEKSLRDHITAELTPEQVAEASEEELGWVAEKLRLPFSLHWPEEPIAQINLVTMCGLTVAGGCLVIGLFSRLSALFAVVFLAMVYLANPPPPLGPINVSDPGRYMFVNKELIECLAALVLVTIPTGRWLGVDALIRGLFTRRLSATFFGTPDDAVR